MHNKTTFKGNYINVQKRSFKKTPISYKNEKFIKSKKFSRKETMAKVILDDQIVPFIPSIVTFAACTSFAKTDYGEWAPPSFMDLTKSSNYEMMTGAFFAQPAYSATSTNLYLM